MSLLSLLNSVKEIAKTAGEIPRAHFLTAGTVDYKGEIDLITEADRETEAFLLDALHKLAPEFGIVGEEGGSFTPEQAPEYLWFIDPIDGTTNFAHRLPHYAVNIAVATPDLRPVLGVTYDPMRDECYSAVEGSGAFLNETRIQVSQASELKRALTVTGFPYDRHTSPENNIVEFTAVSLKAQGVLRLGSASLDLAYVAAGRLDAYWEQKLNRWDCFAGIIMVREAGGLVTDYQGEETGLRAEKVRLIASNGLVHNELQRVINSV
jgi:myo-inositol-1(or 4)-monophosphatase